MLPVFLVSSYAAGIVWADWARPIDPLILQVALMLSLSWCVAATTAIAIRIGRRGESSRAADVRRRDRRAALLRGAGALMSLGLLFLGGHQRLQASFDHAASDRDLAIASSGKEVRFAQAKVLSRRPGIWGDEVELGSVRPTDGHGPLPEKLVLRLARDLDQSEPDFISRADRLLWPGSWVRLGMRVRPLQMARNPGTPNREHRAARRGFGARGRLVKPDWVMAVSVSGKASSQSWRPAGAWRAEWRDRVGLRLEEAGLSASLVPALALGDRSGISIQTRKAFRRTGLSHLVAISGLHIGFIAGLAGWLGLKITIRVCPFMRRLSVFDWSLCLACCGAVVYAWTTDAGVSVERASLLFGLYALSRLARRMIAPLSALAWVALIMLITDPVALFDLGAQLSFTACFSLAATGLSRIDYGHPVPSANADETESSLRTRALRLMTATFRTSLVVSLATAPLLTQHGLPVAALSPLFNVLAIPWTGLVVLPSSLALVSMLDQLSASTLSLLAAPAIFLEFAAVEIASWLPPQFESGHFLTPPAHLAFVAIAAIAIWRGRWRVAFGLWLLISILGSGPLSFEAAIASPPRVIFFEVGQGDAALIQGRESVVLVDTGAGPPDGTAGGALVRGLRAAGVDQIDVVVLTHGDLDHRAGLARVLEDFRVRELWMPARRSPDPALIAAAARARRAGVSVRWQWGDPSTSVHTSEIGDLQIDVLWPGEKNRGLGTSRNDESLVLRVRLEQIVFLFTADIGFEVENELAMGGDRLEADVLKVAHHGSRHSSGKDFLSRVSPKIAVLSAPCDPARGLPNGHSVERLERAGAEVWWTGRDGAITVAVRQGKPMVVRGWGRRRDCSPR